MPARDDTEPRTTLAELAARLRASQHSWPSGARRYFHVSGARGAGAPLVARFAAHALERPMLYVAPDAESADAAAHDLRYLLGEARLGLDPSPGAPPPRSAVQLLLPSDVSPYEQVHPERRVVMRRSSALAALASGQPFA